jgi:hypothetical protein
VWKAAPLPRAAPTSLMGRPADGDSHGHRESYPVPTRAHGRVGRDVAEPGVGEPMGGPEIFKPLRDGPPEHSLSRCAGKE